MALIMLFDLDNGKIVPSIHVHTLKFLKDIIEKYPITHLSVFQYLFYMTCPSPLLNPFFNLPEEDKEEVILQEIKIDFSLDDNIITDAVTKCRKLYETPTYRSAVAAKTMLDKISDYLSNTGINGSSKDGNGAFILRAMGDLTEMRRTCKEAYKDLEDEQKSHVRGNQNLSYDQS